MTFLFFMDFCSYLDFSLLGRRFVLHNFIFLLYSFRKGDSYYTTMFSSICLFFFHLSFDVGFDFGFNICCYFILNLIYVYSGFDFDIDFDFRCDVEIDSVLFLLPVFLCWFWFRRWRFCLTFSNLILTLIVDAGFEIGCWLLMLLFILILFWI